jgi:Polymer-forming cytoskeletal
MKASLFRRLPLVILALAVAIPPAFAKGPSDVTQFGHDIRVGGADQKVGELTCFNCSVYVRGQVGGDITTFHGNVVIDESGVVGGEVTAFLGDVRLDSGTKIGGDVTVFGGKVRRPPTAVIGGEITVFQGTIWVVLALLIPFLILAGIIALIVWLVRRRHRSPTLARAA